MKIAVIAPSPIPFGAGGAEKLWWGLVDNITKSTNHQCELIKLPIKENDFWSLIAAYKLFSELDLSYFDMVISGKYPAWMVQHPNHHVYMLHCLRGLYDTYHFMGMPDKYETNSREVLAFLDQIKLNTISPIDVFYWLEKMKNSSNIPTDLFDFPGVFVRDLVHYFDNYALSNVQKISAISKTVANRLEYFPKGVDVDVIYPPSTLTGFKNSANEFFFTASRLDDAKRIKMIVQAYLQTVTSIPLKIAGTGPLLDELATLAENDNRIEFIGYVSDIALVEYYSKAYAIIFIPYDEDYGLITIEAMKSEKPVISFSDAGGVTEFVEHGVTGLLSTPDVMLLAQNIDKLAADKGLAAKMGQAAKQKVKNITWLNTIDQLILNSQKTSPLLADLSKRKLKKITVVSTYCFYPPQGGGQNRIFYLYKELAKNMRVEIVCLAHESEFYEKKEVAPNLFQIKVPKSQQHALKEWKMQEKAGIPVTDIALINLYDETEALKNAFLASQDDSDLVICNQCYTLPFVEKYSKLPFIHDSQNVESELKEEMLAKTEYNRKLIDVIKSVEKRACSKSVFSTVCSTDDGDKFNNLYECNKYIVVANGVDLHSVKFNSAEEKALLKVDLGLYEQKIVLFIGSWHQPNIEAGDEIIKLALELPNYHFIIIGSVGAYYESQTLPKNIALAGLVTDEEKQLFLTIADVALNPMLTGSGTNLKMLDYMAAGIPVISTEVGARGLNIPEHAAFVVPMSEFSVCLNKLEQLDVELAATHARGNFNWKTIQKSYLSALREAL